MVALKQLVSTSLKVIKYIYCRATVLLAHYRHIDK